jgi:HSP20 family protein
MLSDIVLKAFEPSWSISPYNRASALNFEEFSTRGIHLDIKETEKEFQILADLPGVTKEQTKLEVKDHVLTISYERKFEEKTERETYHRVERFQGTASRSIRLPRNVDEETVAARFDNGVLTVVMQKIPDPQTKTIAIN